MPPAATPLLKVRGAEPTWFASKMPLAVVPERLMSFDVDSPAVPLKLSAPLFKLIAPLCGPTFPRAPKPEI